MNTQHQKKQHQQDSISTIVKESLEDPLRWHIMGKTSPQSKEPVQMIFLQLPSCLLHCPGTVLHGVHFSGLGKRVGNLPQGALPPDGFRNKGLSAS